MMKNKSLLKNNYPSQLIQNLNDKEKLHEILNKDSIVNDLIYSLFGRFIGNGTFREVFEYNLDLNYVIKYEHGGQCDNTSNIREYLIYQNALQTQDPEIIKWFAEVLWISPNHKILVMERTTPIYEIKNAKLPDKIPDFLPDVKESNYGFVGKQLKCHDYGSFINFEFSKKLVKLKW